MRSLLQTWRVGRIESYSFPPALVNKLSERDPAVSRSRAEAAVEELRAWFVARAQHTHLPPPRGLADVAWREFILMTKKYREFCDHGCGGYVHYPPDRATWSSMSQTGMDRTRSCSSNARTW